MGSLYELVLVAGRGTPNRVGCAAAIPASLGVADDGKACSPEEPRFLLASPIVSRSPAASCRPVPQTDPLKS